MLDDLYRELILERYKHPHFKGHVENPDYVYEDENPLCGDHIRVEVKVDETGRIQEARFDGHGCAISMASADLLMEHIQGRPLDEVKALPKDIVFDLVGLQLSPARVKCAMLGFKVLKAALYGLPTGEADQHKDALSSE